MSSSRNFATASALAQWQLAVLDDVVARHRLSL